MSKVVRVSLTGSAFKRIQLLPLDEQGLEILKQHDMNAEEAFGEVYDQLWSENSEQLMEFMFADAYSEMGLCVTDNETDEELYCEDYETDPNYGLMSLEAALENYEDDKEELDNYKTYLDTKCGDDFGLHICIGIKEAWKGLKSNEVSGSTFIPVAMQKALTEAGSQQALLMGIVESGETTVTFYVDIPDGDEFDQGKLDFINIDEDYDDYSEVLQNMLTEDIVSLNAIIYDGKIYFAGHDMIDLDSTDDSDEDLCYDHVNVDMTHHNEVY